MFTLLSLRTRSGFALLTVMLCRGEVASQDPPPSSELLRNANGSNDAFAAVGLFRGGLTCTGSLIDPSGSGMRDARAWLLTAGHCISLDPYLVIRNQPLTGTVQFSFFVDVPPDRRVTVRSRAVGWSTMKGTDLGLVELDATLGDLAAQGIRPLRVAASTPAGGRDILWTGISGAPIPIEMRYVRLGRCTLGERVNLIESSWIWSDVLSNNCPDLYAGASGSPVFDAVSNEVIGVISTSTTLNFEEGPDYNCQVNRPCVMRKGGPVMEKDTSYVAATQGISRCFDERNVLDLERPQCPLDPGLQLTVQSGLNEVRPEVDGQPAAWNATLSGTQRYYSYKRFAAGEGDCGDPAGYPAPLRVADAPRITDSIGREDGYYYLCVIAGDSPSIDSRWQQPSHASVRFKRIDRQAPVVTVDYKLEPVGEAYELVNLTGGEGPTGLGIVLVKRGSPGATDCSDPQDYRVQISIPQLVRPTDWPTRICWKFSDKAGNFADPAVFDFGPPALLPNAVHNGASLKRGTAAPGSAFRVETFNLTKTSAYSATPSPVLAGVQMSLRDSSGRTLPVLMTIAGPHYVDAVVPEAASPGMAVLNVQPPEGPAISQPVEIRRTTPGLYSENDGDLARGYGWDRNGKYFPLGSCTGPEGCSALPLPISSTSGGIDFVLYGTGFRGSTGGVRVRIGTYTVNGEIRPRQDFAGLDELRFHLPQDFPLRLYQAISAETPEASSNHLWMYFQ